MQDHFLMLGVMTAQQKLASFLATMADRVGRRLGRYVEFSLPMSRSDIAAYLGLSIETVSRQITALRKAGLIETDGTRTIILLDPEGLTDVAEAA